MEAVIFCGIQATGKSTFFKEKFFRTHMRISLDQLNTRNKESKFIETCFHTFHPFVVDNTNPSKEERARYITQAKANKYKVIGYYFQSKLSDALERNSQRTGKENIPEIGIKGTFKRLVLPTMEEGFDALYYVTTDNNTFIVKEWSDEI
ncbi:AAA domain-containing protein [Filimonas lacunae]|uniref:AAA domain-containing protein n=2 Tax=Filimonas lacunae TaxID=477680 RepID=A0A173MFR2_9BACT|nr:AAA family ATPase [Filimonas lacunae]BAV06464.1 polynucleotide kinase, 3-phosphatase-like [Filimonas lacunae]SIT27058.1 AAA domain-containing protein [Filimonas lacunae]